MLICSTGAIMALAVLILGPVMGIVLTLVPMAAVLGMHAAARERTRKTEVARTMPSVLRTLATALGSGQTLVQALDYVGLHEAGPVGEVFGRASLRLRCSMSSDEALARLQEELDAPGVALMVCALAISQRTGSPLRDLFRRSAVLVEREGELERMLSVKTAQVRLSARVVCSLPPLMVVLLTVISADYRHGLAQPAGVSCLLMAIALDAVALLAIRKIMRGVLI